MEFISVLVFFAKFVAIPAIFGGVSSMVYHSQQRGRKNYKKHFFIGVIAAIGAVNAGSALVALNYNLIIATSIFTGYKGAKYLNRKSDDVYQNDMLQINKILNNPQNPRKDLNEFKEDEPPQ